MSKGQNPAGQSEPQQQQHRIRCPYPGCKETITGLTEAQAWTKFQAHYKSKHP